MRRFLRFHAASAVSSTYSTEGGRTIDRFHIREARKRRGDHLPARLRFSVRRGVTLVELMISMLILTIVCTAWLEIIGIQSAKKEARRREAVERLAGMMDAFMEVKKGDVIDSDKYYAMVKNGHMRDFEPSLSENGLEPLFEDGIPSIYYQLRVVADGESLGNGMSGNWVYKDPKNKIQPMQWLVGRLTDKPEKDNWFFTLPVCLWRNR